MKHYEDREFPQPGFPWWVRTLLILGIIACIVVPPYLAWRSTQQPAAEVRK